jgi:hypothetical protein
VSLDIEAGTSIAFNLGPAAAAWKTRRAWFAAKFAVETADSSFSRAANAVLCSVEATVCATESAAESYSLFIDSVVTCHVVSSIKGVKKLCSLLQSTYLELGPLGGSSDGILSFCALDLTRKQSNIVGVLMIHTYN